MEPLVRLTSKLFMLLMLFGCGADHIIFVKMNKDSPLNSKQGFFYLNDQKFSGKVIWLTKDKQRVKICTYQEGKEHGFWEEYYVGGPIKMSRTFMSGKKVGFLREWWSNGKLKTLYSFESDEYHGVCQNWNENGILVQELSYQKGQPTGWQKIWYDNGRVKSNFFIKNGRRYGLLGSKNCTNELSQAAN